MSSSGFKTFWLKERADSTAVHQLFVKSHSIKKQEPEYPRGQTLFVLNLPPTATEDIVKKMLIEQFPTVSLVKFVNQLDTHPSTFKNAYVVFDEESDLNKLLSLPQEYVFCLFKESFDNLFGIKKWCTEYNNSIKEEAIIKKQIESYITKYDKLVQKKAKLDAESEKKDEDGWVTVTGKKKRGKFATARKESIIKKIKEKNEIKTKKELVNIYPFQIREAKKQRLIELRKKFELDKAKLQQYKQKRKFRPL